MITGGDVRRLCAEVSVFSRKAGVELSGLPIITWEFADVGAFATAKADLYAALTAELTGTMGVPTRTITEDVVELDCYGATFRLVLKRAPRAARLSSV